MLPVILTRASQALVVGGGKAAAYKFKTLHETGVPITCLSQDFSHLPDSYAIQTIQGDFYTVDEVLFQPFDLIYLAIPYPGSEELETAYKARVQHLLSQGKLVNTCAKPEMGNFIHPATRRVKNLIVSVSTSGQNPKQAVAIAERFRQELEHGL